MGNPASENVHAVARRLRTVAPEQLPELIGHYAEDPRSGVRKAVEHARKRLQDYRGLCEHTRELYDFQTELAGSGLVVGVDEVGRGAVAGPLTVAAVVLPDAPHVIGLDDSKKLTPARREELARAIRSAAVAVGLAHIPPDEIDERGMAASLHKAMQLAIADTGVEPDAVLIDGMPMHVHPQEQSVVHGDARVACIAAASIVAKVTRDALMVLADADYPGYGFASSKGYASAEHIAVIKERGLSDFHRRTFCTAFVEEQGSLF